MIGRRGGTRAFGVIGLALALSLPASAAGQQSVGGGIHFQGYSFDKALGVDVANLVMMPIAYALPLSDNLDADFYTAWARGRVEQANQTFQLDGFVDTRIRVSYRATPWALLTLAASLPTGNASHEPAEALVASVLSSDILGFRESTWGGGFGLTSGVATARQMGEWGVGFGASYRLAAEYEPQADTSLAYEPGNEVRFRLGLDRNVGGSGKFTIGGTFQSYASDQLEGTNLFQAGNRIRIDAGYAFRAGRSTWSLFVANSWRENGEATLPLVDETGVFLRDTTFISGKQYMLIAGASGSIPLFGSYRLRPSTDIRIQNRDAGPGSGWIASAGADLPLRLFGYEVFPSFRIAWGQMESKDGIDKNVIGGEGGITIRWRP